MDNRTKHGKCRRSGPAQKYTAWRNLKARCLNYKHPAWKDYGGRGIALYGPWADFATFDAAVPDPPAPGLTIDRIDNERGYEPGNVRWATRKEQIRNRRLRVTIGSQADATGIPRQTVYSRLRRGQSLEKALTS